MKIKFSSIITKLTKIWLLWMKYHTKSIDETISYKTRRIYAKKCEVLINNEYKTINKLNSFFGE